MSTIDCDPSDSPKAKASPDYPSHPLPVPYSEPCPTARAFLRSRRLIIDYDDPRVLDADQVDTIHRIGTLFAR
jgi:hypothetical protein